MYREYEREDGRCACYSSSRALATASCSEDSFQKTFEDLNEAIEYYTTLHTLLHCDVKIEGHNKNLLVNIKKEIDSCACKFTTEDITFKVNLEYPQLMGGDEYHYLEITFTMVVNGSRVYTADQRIILEEVKSRKEEEIRKKELKEINTIQNRLLELEQKHYEQDRI